MTHRVDDLKLEPGKGWLYRLYLDGELVYIGMTIQAHPMGRIVAHFKDKKFDSYEASQYSVDDLPNIELDEIKKHKPKYNVAGVKKNSQPQFIFHSAVLEQHPVVRSFEKRKDATNYVVSKLRKLGLDVKSVHAFRIYNGLPKWVWVEDDGYRIKDLDGLCNEILNGRHLKGIKKIK